MRFEVADKGEFPAVHPVAAMAMPMARRQTGVLTLRRGALRRRIAYLDGRANRAESNSPRESLPMLLAARGELPKALAESVVEECRASQRNPVEALVATDAIDPDKVGEYLRWRAAFLTVSSGSWTEGGYSFRAVADTTLPGPPLPIRQPQLLLQALLREGSHADLSRRLMPFLGQQLLLVDELPASVEDFVIEDADGELIRALDGSKSVSNCIETASMSADRATCLVWLLLVAGMAETTLSFASGDESRRPRSSTAYVSTTTQREVMAAGDSAQAEPPRAAPVADSPPVPSVSRASAGDGGELSGDGPSRDEPQAGGGDAEAMALQQRVVNLGETLFGAGFTTNVSAAELKRRAVARAALSVDDEDDDEERLSVEEELSDLDEPQRERAEELQRAEAELEGRNFFQLFGVEADIDADTGVIRTAYFELAKQYHPDRFNGEPAAIRRVVQRIFARLSEASETLANEHSRQEYIDYTILGKKTPEQAAMDRARVIMEAEACFKTGVRLLAQGQLTGAHEQFSRAYHGYGEEDDYACYFGYTSWQLKHEKDREAAEEGEQLIRNVIQKRPKHPLPLHLLGKIARTREDHEFARELFKRVVRLEPSNAQALNDLRKADAAVRSSAGAGGLSFGKLFGKKDS